MLKIYIIFSKLDKDEEFSIKKKIITALLRRVSKSQVVNARFKEISKKALVFYVSTRWNSFYLTCMRLLEIYDAVCKLCDENDIDFNIEKSWLLNFTKIIEPFYEATVLLQKEDTPLAYGFACIMSIITSLSALNINEVDLDHLKDVLIIGMNERFKQYIDLDEDNFDSRLLIAAALHPVTKDRLPREYKNKAILILEDKVSICR